MSEPICCECGQPIDKTEGYTVDNISSQWWCIGCEPEDSDTPQRADERQERE